MIFSMTFGVFQIYHFFGDFCYILVISFFMCVLIEQPFVKAVNILMNASGILSLYMSSALICFVPVSASETTATNEVNLANHGSEIRDRKDVDSCK